MKHLKFILIYLKIGGALIMKSVKTVAKVIKVLSSEKKYAMYENSLDKYNYYMKDMFCDTGLKDEPYEYYVENSWYEHMLEISYKSNNKTYEGLVTLITDRDNVQELQRVNIEYEKENPYNIISVTIKNRFAVWWIVFASLGFITLMSYIIHLIL